MKDDLGLGARQGEGPQPTSIERLSEQAIRQHLRLGAVQHPMTLLPLAVCIMSGVYLLVLTPVFGGGFWPVVVLVVSGVAAVTSFIWRYIFRYSEEYAERVREATALRDVEVELAEQSRAAQLREQLEVGFSGIGSAQGLGVFFKLVGAYERLETTLSLQANSDLASISRVPALAEETYRRGMSVLSDALELLRVVDGSSVESLERDVAELEEEVEASRADGAHLDRLRIKEKVLASHRERLELHDQLRWSAERLLFQAHKCEDSLHRTRIELVAIKTGTAEASVNSVIEALQRTVTQAKEVQRELRRLGY